MRAVITVSLVAAIVSIATGAPAARAASRDVAPAPLVRLAQQDQPDDQGDASAAVVRLGRMEEQLRTMTGQIEELQHQNKVLQDNMRKLQADTDFRFQDLQRGTGAGAAPARPSTGSVQRRGDATDATGDAAGQTVTTPAEPTRAARQTGDAFDPDANPNAPGAPRALGTTTPSQPLTARGTRQAAADDTHAPLDLMRSRPATATDGQDGAGGAPSVITAPAGAPRDTTAVASLAPGGTRDEYDGDVGLFKQGQFDASATGFAAFADKYPKDRLVPDALYLAGESYARLGRHREAAEQFLKVSTDFGKSSRAPEALLRLGVSLNALGAKDQACATYQEVTRRYPTASADVKSGVDRELKRARCPGNG